MSLIFALALSSDGCWLDDSGAKVTPDADSFEGWSRLLLLLQLLPPAGLIMGEICFVGFNVITVTSLVAFNPHVCVSDCCRMADADDAAAAAGSVGWWSTGAAVTSWDVNACDSQGQIASSDTSVEPFGWRTGVRLRVAGAPEPAAGSTTLAESHGQTSKSVDGWLSTLHDKLLVLAGLASNTELSNSVDGASRAVFVRLHLLLGGLIDSQGHTSSSRSDGRLTLVVDGGESLLQLDLRAERQFWLKTFSFYPTVIQITLSTKCNATSEQFLTQIYGC